MNINTLEKLGNKAPFTDRWREMNTALGNEGFPPLSAGSANAYFLEGSTDEYILKRARDCRDLVV